MVKPFQLCEDASAQHEDCERISHRTGRLLALHAQGGRVRDLDAGGAFLVSANLDGLHGDGIRLVAANLSQALVRQAHLTACDLSEANLSDTNLADSTLRMCTLDGARACGAHCEGARIEDSSLHGADFSQACLRGVRLTESSWVRASLRGAVLDEAQGDGVEFRGTDLRGASLVRAEFVDADFRGADLTGADLSGGDFRGADFRGAILEAVQWADAVCTGARFDEESPNIQSVLPAQGQATVPAAALGDISNMAAKSPTGSDALTAALAQLVSQALSSAAQGTLKLDQECEKVSAEWAAWRSHIDEPGMDDVAELFENLQRAFGASGMLPPALFPALTRLLRGVADADDLQPPKVWEEWLTKLFPEIVEADDSATLDALASRLMAMCRGDKRERP